MSTHTSPSSSPAHVRRRLDPSIGTVVAWITDSDGNVLILRKPDEAIFRPPGGEVDNGETMEQAVIREVMQETGLNLPAVCSDEGHKTVHQWVVFAAPLTGDRPVVVPQSEYSDGEAVWVKPEDIVVIQPPGARCACSGCDALTAKDKLFFFQRPNSDRWICAACKPVYETMDGYTLKIRAGYRLTQTLRAVTNQTPAARPGATIRDAGRIVSFTTPTRQYVPGGDKLLEALKTTPTVLIDADCGLGKSTCIRDCLEKLHAERQGALRILLVHDVGIHALHAFESTGAGEDSGIDHNKNLLRFPYDSTFLRSHYLHPHPYVHPGRLIGGARGVCVGGVGGRANVARGWPTTCADACHGPLSVGRAAADDASTAAANASTVAAAAAAVPRLSRATLMVHR
eukprot:COSAG01_NODE_2713_length_7209_cov_5.300844_1_plen_399_part_00